MLGAQVVGVRLGVRGEGAEDGSPVGVDVGQGGDRGLAARRLGAPTGQVHLVTLGGGTDGPAQARRSMPVVSARDAGTATAEGCGGRWRGPRCPRWRAAGERFDALVLDAADRVRPHLGTRYAELEFAVEEVPPQDPAPWEEQTAPLGRLLRGTATPPEPGRRLPAAGRGPGAGRPGPRRHRPRGRHRAGRGAARGAAARDRPRDRPGPLRRRDRRGTEALGLPWRAARR